MKCPSCQTEAPSDAEFCPDCGLSLLVPCPQCRTSNSAAQFHGLKGRSHVMLATAPIEFAQVVRPHPPRPAPEEGAGPSPSQPSSTPGPGAWGLPGAAPGPRGSLPLTAEMLRDSPSGDIFGLTQNAGMGWDPRELGRPQYLMLSTQGGVRAADGRPIALGYHTGHWEVGLLMQAAAEELVRLECLPFAAFCSDPCDGRTQGTTGMMDSLAYRNDAAIVFRRLIRSLPTRKGVLGIATCDKGLPAMMLALSAMRDLPCVLVPGGVTLPPTDGEDAGKVQSIGARFAQGELTLEEASDLGCRACGSPGGGCQFLGTAATSQVVGEALGLSLPHSALAPSGQPIWLDMASALSARDGQPPGPRPRHARHRDGRGRAQRDGRPRGLRRLDESPPAHLPAAAHAAGLKRPTVDDWNDINRRVPRLVDALPNGPRNHPTVRVFLAGGVPGGDAAPAPRGACSTKAR